MTSIDTSTTAVEARCRHLDHCSHDGRSPDAALMRKLVAERDATRNDALEEAATLAEYYAGHYPDGTDGSNTFTILADTLRRRQDPLLAEKEEG